ncbi:MAG: FtsX-like permease family protein [Polyangiaceae bacterium]|nr:FtsX-like permease family protein [Polyangiaceae bacterium]
MRRIALLSLAHDRGKLVASLAGVAFAATLVVGQIGLYVGFLESSSAVVRHAGGDVWVMARGTAVVDNGERLSAGSRAIVASHPCVARVRALVMAFLPLRKPDGSLEAVQVVGYEPVADPVLPWSLARGLPQDLHGPGRVAIDGLDVRKLQIGAEPLGAVLTVGTEEVYVAAVTRGIRAFTLAPYVFAEIDTARRLARMGGDQAYFWLADLARPECRDDVIAAVKRHGDLDAHAREEFRRMTENYWVAGSGAGTALGFSALLGLVVGAVIVGQTLYAVTKEHLRELATLKAIGATPGEVVSFVTWQAAVLACVGGGLGFLFAYLLATGTAGVGLVIVLSPTVLLIGAGAVLTMCTVAAIWSIRAVLTLEAAEVFR